LKDKIYSQHLPHAVIAPFEFNAEVVAVFQDMISRSVPGYSASIELALVVANQICRSGDHIYDLGCSLGATTFALIHQAMLPPLRVTALDLSKPMIDSFAATLTTQGYVRQDSNLCQHFKKPDSEHTVQLIQGDITQHAYQQSRLIVLNYVLQFIKPSSRQSLLDRLYRCLNDGGMLILSEKIMHADQSLHSLMDKFHLEFKKLQGYSELEINGKRTALEKVLIPDSLETQVGRLKAVGFREVIVGSSHLNFASLIAIK